MLKYLEETTVANVKNQNIAAVENLVNKVKRRKEVSISYMKSWEWEQMIRDEATQEGLQKGLQIGKEEGRQIGKEEDMPGVRHLQRRCCFKINRQISPVRGGYSNLSGKLLDLNGQRF